jgi:hypothetical protein
MWERADMMEHEFNETLCYFQEQKEVCGCL